MYIPEEIKIQAMKELPDDCKGKSKCIKQPIFQAQCECECYKTNLARLVAEYRRNKK